MGRITIYSLKECPHCQRCKGALKERNIPYTEINLSAHPAARTNMLQLTDRLSVPQVFFNEQHIGGADETIAVLLEWDKEDGGALKKYIAEIKSQPAPSDERLRVPTAPPVVDQPPPPRPDVDSVRLPTTNGGGNNANVSVLELTTKLKISLPANDLKYNLTMYKKCFTGQEAVAAFMNEYTVSQKDAVQFGKLLVKQRILHHVCDDHDFEDTANLFYRLQCYHTPNILNSYRIWSERVDPNALQLVKILRTLLGKIESAVTDDHAGTVNYKKATIMDGFDVFEEAVSIDSAIYLLVTLTKLSL